MIKKLLSILFMPFMVLFGFICSLFVMLLTWGAFASIIYIAYRIYTDGGLGGLF